jgi:hypothetical protein
MAAADSARRPVKTAGVVPYFHGPVPHKPFRAAGTALMAALFCRDFSLVRFFSSTGKEMNSHGWSALFEAL